VKALREPVHDSFQTERYSRPRHLAAPFPFTAQVKNRKTPLSNRPIRWRTLYFSQSTLRNLSLKFILLLLKFVMINEAGLYHSQVPAEDGLGTLFTV